MMQSNVYIVKNIKYNFRNSLEVVNVVKYF